MWNIDPKNMCREHLLGEHLECHMFCGVINKGSSIRGYVEKGLVEVHNLHKRHNLLVEEMNRRGYKHKTPIKNIKCIGKIGKINMKKNIKELKKRCKKCFGKLK